MSAFRSYLKYKNAQVDPQFNERDETYFVLAMLLLRLGFHGRPGQEVFEAAVANAPESDDPLASMRPGPETEAALVFVSTFLCFFAIKPAAFMTAISQFKHYFVPNFSHDRDKRTQLFQLVNPSFSQAPLRPAEWKTLEHFFREEWQREPAVARG